METAAIKTITPEADPATTPVFDVFLALGVKLTDGSVVVAGGAVIQSLS